MSRIARLIQTLSARSEFVIVVGLSLGPFMLKSLYMAVAPSQTPPIDERHLEYLVVDEILVLAALVSFLAVRGRTWRDFGISPPQWRDALMGVVLGVSGVLAYWLCLWVLVSVVPFLDLGLNRQLVQPGLRLATVLAASLINAFFEEICVCAYVVTALRERGDAWRGINTSVAIRLIYHLYQGPISVVSILPFGLLFAWWFGRYRRLWPLVIGHALVDVWALTAYIAAPAG